MQKALTATFVLTVGSTLPDQFLADAWRIEQKMLEARYCGGRPFVVASVGDLQAVEDKIMTPTVRSIVVARGLGQTAGSPPPAPTAPAKVP